MIKAIKELTPQKLLIYFLSIAISFLWYKLENVEEKGDGKDIKKEMRYDKLQFEKDSLQSLRVKEKQECSDAVALKDEEMKQFLKDMLAEQNKVKQRVKKIDKKVDNALTQTVTKLNHD